MRTSNELSTLYKSIDQKNISDSAKETLKKIRLANKNWKGKDEDAQELFIEFFNKLKSSKPVAVKTTKEYKDALKKAQSERGKTMGNAKKKATEPKGAGTEEDANRPAKPFGWRMRGKHNYRKPTRDDISKGKAYYEGRVNRADVKRKKYPMLERGGMAEEVYYVDDFYPNYDEDKIAKVLKDNGFKKVRKAKKYGWSNQPDVVVFEGSKNKAQEILEKEFDNYISIYEKDWGRKYEEGGMSEGVSILEDITECKKLVSAFCEKFGEKFGLDEEKVLNNVKFQDYLGHGASVFISLSVTSNITNLKVGETKPLGGYIKLTSDINPNGITGKDDIARTYSIDIEIKGDKRYTSRRTEEGKYFKSYNYGRTIDDVIEETSSKIFYDLNSLERKDDLKFKMSNLFADGGYMAKGGEIGNYRVIPYKRVSIEGSPDLLEPYYSLAFTVVGSLSEANERAQKYIIVNEMISATVTKIHPSGQALKNKKVSYVTKDEILKYEDGGKLEEKLFSIYPHSIGKAKYVVDVYDGKSTHKDGSPFIGISTAKSKIQLNSIINSLKEDGFKEVYNVSNYLEKYEDGGMAEGGEFPNAYLEKEELDHKINWLKQQIESDYNNGEVDESTERYEEELESLQKRRDIIMSYSHKYAKGGAIENQYEGRTAEDVWDSWTKEQKMHFLDDHNDEFQNVNRGEKRILSSLNFSDIEDDKIVKSLQFHIKQGQYAKGGYIEKYYDKKENVDFLFKKDDKIKVLQYSGGKLKKSDAIISEQYAAEQPDGTYYPFYKVIGSWDIDNKYPILYSEDELVVRNGNKPSKMADGGEVKNYKTSVGYYPNQEVIAFVDFSGKHKSVMSRPYSEANKEEVIEFAKKIAERNNGTYEGYYDFSNALKMAKGGTIDEMAVYVSARDIEEIKLTINGDKKTLKGSDLMDGVYVKKASLKAKFDAYEVYNKLSDMSYNVWDKLNIESGSQIYASDSVQNKLAKEYEIVGIDSIYKSLTKPQRKKVSEILTDENQHSLRNYLALRGYNGETEYNSYKTMYDGAGKNKYSLSPSAITRVVTMEEGGEVFYTEKHKND